MKIALADAPASDGAGRSSLSLSGGPGGLTQFGCSLETLAPGAWSSTRHWHSAEDEFLFVLEGVVTLQDDAGMTELYPGDAVCWPFGDPNAHHLTNRGQAPCRYIIAGSRVAGDICTYPDDGRRQVNFETTWQMQAEDGTVLRGGDLPAELLNLPPLWGRRAEGRPQRIQRAATRHWVVEDGYVHPILGPLGPYRHCVLGDPGGLSQFGVHLEELPAGGLSSFRHWHEAEDELVYVLSGQPLLVEDAETPLAPGQGARWRAGVPVGHCLNNPGPAPAVYLTFGTRLPQDIIHYTDHDLITHKDGAARRYLRRDGSPWPQGGKP